MIPRRSSRLNLLIDTVNEDRPYTGLVRRAYSPRPCMPEQPNPRRPKRGSYVPKPETIALLTISGNPINGLGEMAQRKPSPFFWHPPTLHPYADLQIAAREQMSKCPGYEEAFSKAHAHSELVPVAAMRTKASPEELTRSVSGTTCW